MQPQPQPTGAAEAPVAQPPPAAAEAQSPPVAAPAAGGQPAPSNPMPAPSAPGAEVPQADSPQAGQTYVIQHPWPGTEGPLTIKKEGVEQKNAQSNKDSPGDAVVVA